MFTYRRLFIGVAALFVSGPLVQAVQLTATSDSRALTANMVFSSELDTNADISFENDSNLGVEPIFVFQLPSEPTGQQVASANFQVGASRLSPTAADNVDLYALPPGTTSALSPSEFFAGPFGTDPSATAVESDLIGPSVSYYMSGYDLLSTSDLADDILSDYLNAAYTQAGAGGYIFLRLSLDEAPATPPNQDPSGQYYAGVISNLPADLNITFTPEPSAAFVFLVPLVLWGFRGEFNPNR